MNGTERKPAPRWTLGQKIIAGFMVPLVILLLIGVLCYRSTDRLVDASEMRTHTHQVLRRLDEVQTALSDAQRGARGYVLTEQEAYLEPYHDASRVLPGVIADIERLTSDNARQQQRLTELKPLIRSHLDEQGRIVAAQKSDGNKAAVQEVRSGRGKAAMDRVRAVIQEMEAEEERLLKTREAVAEAATRTAWVTIMGGTGAGAVFILVAAFALTRAVTRPVRETIQHLSTVSTELLAATAQQAAGTQEQAAAVAETATTVDEVVQTADQTAQRAKGVGEAIQRTHEIGQAGRKSVEESISALNAVQQWMGTTAENILALAEQAQAIGEIIATVNDIAEQTNLLALNAAIEASRAGEHGLGFSVVAGEVKVLADQSKKATAQVRQILGQIQKATNTAVLSTEEVSKGVAAANRVAVQSGETIRVLTDTLAEAAQASIHIVASAGQQSVGTAQIHQAMRNIDTVAKQSLAAVRQTEQAAQNLNELSSSLVQLIGN
ncbi:MAG: CHASE3 domain-containing protein [Gemmataceae bacterium]|nr:CHASE3 domain-containing protein [Gemmataceae bacterium]